MDLSPSYHSLGINLNLPCFSNDKRSQLLVHALLSEITLTSSWTTKKIRVLKNFLKSLKN